MKHSKRLLDGLVRELFARNSIKTTLARTKAVQPLVERAAAKAKKGEKTRAGGYTRIVKLGTRRGDASEEAMLSFVDTYDKTHKNK